ncbi:MAG: enoyl-CoA hydratase-related protein [Actinomycetota bacterium]|nr:enoyl-CoA hydratase-related protein [Actinomycetota bacterium]
MNDIDVSFDGAVATVTLDRPPVNAVTLAHYQRLGEIFEELGRSTSVNCVIFTAAGTRAFCAGLDLHEFMAATVEDDPVRAAVVRQSFARIRSCAIPVIAAVNGPALGAGAVFAAVCDVRIASEAAKFSMPEINVGRCGGGAHLGRLVNQGALRKMFFTGEPIDAAEALRIGLVDQVAAADQLQQTARDLAEKIAAKSPIGLRMGKQSLNEIEGLPVEEGYQIEQGYSTRLMATEDAREATRAVIEKRAPVFTGN